MSNGIPEVAPLPSNSSAFGRIRHWLRTVLGLDRAIGFTVLARFWGSAAGLVTVALIARFLSLPSRDIITPSAAWLPCKSFLSLASPFVILQLASHERAELSISSDYEITGNPTARARLASADPEIGALVFGGGAADVPQTVLPLGLFFFSMHDHTGHTVSWLAPWCLDALMAALNFQIDPLLSFLEGCGYVPEVARLLRGVTGSLLAWLALVVHHGLFAPSMMLLGMALASLVWLVGKRKLLFGFFTCVRRRMESVGEQKSGHSSGESL